MSVENNQLVITDWIVVWDSTSQSRSPASSVGWWNMNTIGENSSYAWIAWWHWNRISSWENSIIGWWMNNTVGGSNAIVVWWEANSVLERWNVVWWYWNSAENNWVVLWWSDNIASDNSLVLWANAVWAWKSFSWNASAWYHAARIDASNWVLIWTTQPLTGVNLVVNGAVKLWGTNSVTGVAWEIKVVNWCFYAYDWVAWHVMNRNSTWECNDLPVSQICKFGNVELQEWDVVIAYKATISPTCEYAEVTCTNWEFVDAGWNTDYKYPYCYNWLGEMWLPGWDHWDDWGDDVTCDTSNWYVLQWGNCVCAANYYKVWDECVACPSGSHTPNWNTSTSCITCEGHQVWNWSSCSTPRATIVHWIGWDGYSNDSDALEVRYVWSSAGSATAKIIVMWCSSRYHDTSWPSYSAYPSWIHVSPLSDSIPWEDYFESEITISWDENTSQYPRWYVGDEHDSRIVFRWCDYSVADKLFIQQASSYGCPWTCYNDWWNCKDAHPGSSNYSSHSYICEKIEWCWYCTWSET